MSAGGVLRAVRTEMGVTQAAAAARFGVSRTTLSRLENGHPVADERWRLGHIARGYGTWIAERAGYVESRRVSRLTALHLT